MTSDKLVEYFAEDAMIFPYMETRIRGHAKIKLMIERFMEKVSKWEYFVDSEYITDSKEMAVTTGR